jgi:hypothetical protein
LEPVNKFEQQVAHTDGNPMRRLNGGREKHISEKQKFVYQAQKRANFKAKHHE